MKHSPIEHLWMAHRRRSTGVLRVQSHLGDLRMWMSDRNVVEAEGLRVFQGDEAWLSRPEAMSGVLSQDLGVAIDSGMVVDNALNQACLKLGTYLATLVEQGWETATWEDGPADDSRFALPWPALRIFTRGLREQRHPDAVAEALRIHWDDPLHVDIPDGDGLHGLDIIALRTLKIARHLDTLGELITQSGRGQVERTRHVWRAVDLLLQLRLLRVGPVPVQWDESVTSPLPDLSLTAPWRPIHEPEVLTGALPDIEFLGPLTEELPTAILPDVEIVDDDPSDALSPLEMDLQRVGALCVEVNPLAVLEFDPDRLHGVITHEEIKKHFRRGADRFAVDHFEHSSLRDTAQALKTLLDDARESIEDPGIVSIWLRDLRLHTRMGETVTDADRREALANIRAAKEHAGNRDWERALGSAVRAIRLDPDSHQHRILQVFCLVALRRLSPMDGVLNLDALELLDPKDQAQAQVTAARLLKAARQPEAARVRFERALELDPARKDAQAELGGSLS